MDKLIQWDKSMLLQLNGHHSPWMDNFMWGCSQTLIWIPFFCLFLVLLVRNKQSGNLLLILALALLILFTDQLASGIFKPLVHRLRPTHDPEIGALVHCVNGYKGGQYGFFSSHAANMFAFAGFSALLIRNRYYSIVILLWAALVSYSRIYLGVHFPLDVLTGMLAGLLASFLFFKIYTFFEKGKNRRTSAASKRKKSSKALLSGKEAGLLILVLVTIIVTCLSFSKKLL